jgi:DsbC/DsbD-like thiol-disulfide interchange protein
MAGMNFSVLLAASLPLVAPLFAGVRSGHAAAELVSGVSTYQAGKPFAVAIRLTIDPGWHSYWINPGVGGMPLKANWTLPDGWQAGELRHPVPKRFTTGELPGFGYEGEVLFLVDLTPPAGATGAAECKVELAWLTCDENACVPGEAELAVEIPAGDGAAGTAAALLAEAGKLIPVPLEGLELEVAEKDGKWVGLVLHAPAGFDPTGCSVFPATPDVIDAAAEPGFVKNQDVWTAVARKNEYADGPATRLDLVLAGGKLSQALVVSWRSAK